MRTFALLALSGWCAVLAGFDLWVRRLPNALTGFGAVAIAGYALATGRSAVAVAGALLLAVPYLLVHVAMPRAFGAGDVKLAFGLGAAAACGGAQTWVWAALTAPVVTALAGAVKLLIRGPTADDTVPHGPSMCACTLVALWSAS